MFGVRKGLVENDDFFFLPLIALILGIDLLVRDCPVATFFFIL